MLLAVSNGTAKWYPIYDEQEADEFVRKTDPGNDDGEYQYGWYFITPDRKVLGFLDLGDGGFWEFVDCEILDTEELPEDFLETSG
jgi:hypothetical protein